MKFNFDHDLHIHSQLSSCSRDPKQNTENILKYAEDNGLNTICLTDHFWDETVKGASLWYRPQNYAHICKAKPLPQSDNVRFLFGCEAEITRHNVLGLSKKVVDELDFIVIPTTHFHMRGFTISRRDGCTAKGMAKNWIDRLDHVLNMDLPFYKIGIAHLTTSGIEARKGKLLETIDAIPVSEMEKLFKKAAQLGVGIELNSDDMEFTDEEADIILMPYRIAKECGCKFYCGSDAHTPRRFETVKEIFERSIDMLELEETDKIGFLTENHK